MLYDKRRHRTRRRRRQQSLQPCGAVEMRRLPVSKYTAVDLGLTFANVDYINIFARLCLITDADGSSRHIAIIRICDSVCHDTSPTNEYLFTGSKIQQHI